MGGFMNDIDSSFENLSQEKIQNAIDVQPKIMEEIIAAQGVIQSIWAVDLRQEGIDFYERISTNFDKKKVCTMGKMIKWTRLFIKGLSVNAAFKIKNLLF